MRRVLTIALALFCLVSQAIPCHQRVAAAMADPSALGAIAQKAGLNSSQLKYLLASPHAERTQALLVAQFLIDERGPEIIRELYWRVNGSTKYASGSNAIFRFYEWVKYYRFWSPFYRDRKNLFGDSLNALGEKVSTPLLNQFTTACLQIEHPGFLRGLPARMKEFGAEIESYAKAEVASLRSELAVYSRLYSSGKQVTANTALQDQFRKFILSIYFIPNSRSELESLLEQRFQKLKGECPKIAGAVKALVLKFHAWNAPPSWQGFQTEVQARFEAILVAERNALLEIWKRRQRGSGGRPVTRAELSGSDSAGEAQDSEDSCSDDSGDSSDSDEEGFSSLAVDTGSESDQASFEDLPADPPSHSKRDSSSGGKRLRREFKDSAANPAAKKVEKAPNDKFVLILTASAREQRRKLNENSRLKAQIIRALNLLAENPMHPGLHTHEYYTGTAHMGGIKVWSSRINQSRGAHRIFWHYGEAVGTIEITHFCHHDEY